MCLAAKGRLQGWAAKLLLLWVGIFYFFSFQICNHVTAVSFFWLAYNGWVYETFGISKRFPIRPLQCLLYVPHLKLALSAKCFIYRVTGRYSSFFQYLGLISIVSVSIIFPKNFLICTISFFFSVS